MIVYAIVHTLLHVQQQQLEENANRITQITLNTLNSIINLI